MVTYAFVWSHTVTIAFYGCDDAQSQAHFIQRFIILFYDIQPLSPQYCLLVDRSPPIPPLIFKSHLLFSSPLKLFSSPKLFLTSTNVRNHSHSYTLAEPLFTYYIVREYIWPWNWGVRSHFRPLIVGSLGNLVT